MKNQSSFDFGKPATMEEFNELYPSILISLRYLAGDLGLASICLDLDYAITRAPISLETARRDRAALSGDGLPASRHQT